MARARLRGGETQRLERGAGSERVFWEITRNGSTITTRFGRHLSAGRRIEKDLEDVAEAKRAYAKMIADKRKDGYGDPPQKAVVGGASVKGVSVRSPELERLVEADPLEPQGYLVYADWLQEQGDPRGELIALQHARSLDPDSSSLERAEATLLEKYAEELLGPLAKHSHVRTTFRSHRGLAWRFGFLRAARLRRISDTRLSDVVRLLLEHPSGRFLERLVLGRASYGSSEEGTLDGVYSVLAERAPPTLRWLLLGDGSAEIGDLDRLWTAMPALRCLILDGRPTSFGTVRAESLEELVLSFTEEPEITSVTKAHFPALKRLSLTLSMPTADEDGTLTILSDSEGLPSLEHLHLRRWMTRDESSQSSSLIRQESLPLEAVRFAATRRLSRLDLEMPLTDAVGQALLSQAPALRAIRSLRIPTEAIESAALRDAIGQALPAIEWTEPPIASPLADLEELDVGRG